MKNRKAKKGFTIIELVIVIAVIGILAGVLIPTFSNVISDANKTAAMEEAKNAYTNYLTLEDNATKLSSMNFTIKVTKGTTDYYFVVTNGQFGTEAKNAAESNATVYTIENNTLKATTTTGGTTDSSSEG